jgi:DNA-binding transcriptional ArsR family regulator
MTPAAAPEAARLDRLFTALADGGRRRMLERLGEGPASVSDLARPLRVALPSAMKHLAVLEAGGLVRSEKAGRTRTYRLAPGGLDALEAWVAARKRTWNAAFDRLDAYLDETGSAGQ